MCTFILNVRYITYQHRVINFYVLARAKAQLYKRISLLVHELTADILITITNTVIHIPIETTGIRAVIPIAP